MSKINRDFLEFISGEDPTLGIFFQFLTVREILAFGSTCRNASALMRNAEFEVTIDLRWMLHSWMTPTGLVYGIKMTDTFGIGGAAFKHNVLSDIGFLPIEKCVVNIPLEPDIIDHIKFTEPSVWSRFRAFNIGTSTGQLDVYCDFTGERIHTTMGKDLIPLFENAKYIKSIRIGSGEMLRSLGGFESKVGSAVITQSVPAWPVSFLTSVPYEVVPDWHSWNYSHIRHKIDPRLLRFATHIKAITFSDGLQVNTWLEHASKTAKIELHKLFFKHYQPEDLMRLIDVKRRFNVLLELEADNLVISPELEHAVDVFLDSKIALLQAVRYRTSLHKFKYLRRYKICVNDNNETTIQQALDMIVNLPPTAETLDFDIHVQNMDFGAYDYSAEFEEACKRITYIRFFVGSQDLTDKIDLRIFLGFFPNLETLRLDTGIPRTLETLKTFFILPENPRFKVIN